MMIHLLLSHVYLIWRRVCDISATHFKDYYGSRINSWNRLISYKSSRQNNTIDDLVNLTSPYLQLL